MTLVNATPRKPRLVVIGDSLGLPRREVQIDETYTALVQDALPHWRVISRHWRGNHTRFEVRDRLQDDIQTIVPDCIVLHLGHIDCVPRLYTERERLVISNLPVRIRNGILRVGARYRFTLSRLRRRTYVTIGDFERNLMTICEAARKTNPAVQFVFLGIARTNDANKRRTFGFDENIRAWNGVLERVARAQGAPFIDLYNILNPSADLLEDGIHLTTGGNRIVCERIAVEVRRMERGPAGARV